MSAVAESVLDLLGEGVLCVTETFEVTTWNRFMVANTGLRADEVLGKHLFDCVPDLPQTWLAWKVRSVFQLGTHAFSSWQQRPYVFRFSHDRPLTGGIDYMRQDVRFVPVKADGGDAVVAVAIIIHDATDAALSELALARANASLEREMEQRQRLEIELRLAQRLEAVGQLSAGLAHEMNTPLQFLGDSVQFLADAHRDVMDVLEAYRTAAPAPLAELEDRADLAFLTERIPATFDATSAGLARIGNLVRSMTAFGDRALSVETDADLHQALDATLTITAGQYRDVADVVRDFAALPRVTCRIGELNQAFYNLIVNAAHAIAETRRAGGRGTLTIRTRCEDDHVVIAVGDDGAGIADTIRDRVFEPFFTTKPVGRGTGQGLSITRAIVERHHGTVWFDTRPGEGTTFFIRLPISRRTQDACATGSARAS